MRGIFAIAMLMAATPVAAQDRAPLAAGDTTVLASGIASYYGGAHAGNRTASGERFNPAGLTAAHRTLPFGTKLRVTDKATGKSVIVRVNDRGPFHKGRMIDISEGAARELGMIRRGNAHVEIALVDNNAATVAE